MFWTDRVTLGSTSNFWSMISSRGSMALAVATNRTHATHGPHKRKRLFIAQRYHRIDFHGATRGNVTRQGRGGPKKADHAGIGRDVRAPDAIQHRRNKTGETDRSQDADNDPCNYQGEALPENHRQH